MFANFHMPGNFCYFNGVSNSNLRVKAIDSPQLCIIFIEILSQPCALFESRFFMINEISLWFMRKELILTLVLHISGGIVFPLYIGVHIEAKKSLNRLALVKNSETNLPFTNKGGIPGIRLINLLYEVKYRWNEYHSNLKYQ